MPAPALSGRQAIVTCGASGIGKVCARKLAEAGAQVTVADRDADAAAEVASDLGGIVWEVDLSDTAALTGLSLSVDILVNCAGLEHVAPVEDFPPETFSLLLRVMLEAPFLLIQAALPHMYAARFGRIVNVSSVYGLRGSEFNVACVAAKHGLEGLSKVVAREGGRHGVTSSTVCPGYVRTPLLERQIAALARLHGIAAEEVVEKVLLREPAVSRLIAPDEVAELVLYLCGPAATAATGTSFVLDGGWTAS